MIEIQNVSKTFVSGRTQVEALHDVNISIPDGSIFGIIGSSGAGKSTLVRCINMLERPTSGEVYVDGLNVGDLTPSQLRAARRGIAMIFQQFNLLMQRNCLANIRFPMELAGIPKAKAEEKAKELLALVGLPEKGAAYPAQLSGGQKQRVAIARALATDPKVLLCDEATSALDPATTRQILELIREINRQTGITVVVITHQMSVVEEICDRVAILDGGRVAEQGPVSKVLSAPRSDAGKRLVFPGRTDERISVSGKDRRLRIIFRESAATSLPLVATMAREKGIIATVLEANTRKLSGDVYGTTLIGLPEKDLYEAAKFLSSFENVSVEEVTEDVQ